MIDTTEIRLVDTDRAFVALLRDIQRIQPRIVGIDTEFTNLDVYRSRLLLTSIYFDTVSYVIDFTKLPTAYLQKLKPLLEDESILKIGHNLIAEWKQFYHHSKLNKEPRVMMAGMHDTMIAEQMILAGLGFKFDLRTVTARRLGIDLDKQIRTEFIDWPEGATFTPEQIEYSGKDAVIPILIYQQQMQEIEQRKLERIYDLEMHIIAPTAMMEYTGVPVNRSMLEEMIQPFQRYIDTADKAFQDILIDRGAAEQITFSRDGYFTVNANSRDQVKAALTRIGIDIRDKSGKPSLNSKVVQRWDMLNTKRQRKYKDFDIDYHTLIDDEEVADALDLYLVLNNKVLRAYVFAQGADKLLNTFIMGLIHAINPITKRIHPNFKSYGAHRTGRYSSTEPNFQNLPNDKKLKILGLGAYSIRKTIEAALGRKLIISDYSGIELVILAVLSEDTLLMDEIIRGDIHTAVTINVLNYKDITAKNKKEDPHKLWRDAAKTLSYGIAYGTTGRNISETLNIMLGSVGFKIDAKTGDELIERWFKLFPKTAAYLETNAKRAVNELYVTDTWGRRRNWDRDILYAPTNDAKWKRLAAGREGKNMPIQGTSATMTKLAIRLLWEHLDLKKARIIITVHDEIVLEAVDSYIEEAKRIMKWAMEEAIRQTLPVIIENVGKYESLSVDPKESERYDK